MGENLTFGSLRFAKKKDERSKKMKMFTKIIILAMAYLCISPLSAKIKEYGDQTINTNTASSISVAADKYGFTYYLYTTVDAGTGKDVLNLTIIKKTQTADSVVITDSLSVVVETDAFSNENIILAEKGVVTLQHDDAAGKTTIVQYKLKGKTGITEVKELDPLEMNGGTPTLYNDGKNFYTITGADGKILTIYKTKKLQEIATETFTEDISWLVDVNETNKVIIIEEDGAVNTTFYVRSMQKLKKIGEKQYTTASVPFYHILGKEILFSPSFTENGVGYWQFDIYTLKTMKEVATDLKSYSFGPFGEKYLLTQPNADTPAGERTYKLYNW